ncbi:MAG TPA: hypothetical protein PLW33_05105 [Candidatus Cloacimonas sp.]|nr:hypothetical protein [Candidatus Cloacimonas sp.]
MHFPLLNIYGGDVAVLLGYFPTIATVALLQLIRQDQFLFPKWQREKTIGKG